MAGIQLNMVALLVRDMAASLAFYRRLGLEIPEDADVKPSVLHRMDSGVTLVWDTVVVNSHDPGRTAPKNGYQIVLEFFLGSEAAVDQMYAELTAAGYHGRSAGQKKDRGPYAALVDDPDGNVVLLTSEPQVD